MKGVGVEGGGREMFGDKNLPQILAHLQFQLSILKRIMNNHKFGSINITVIEMST